MESPLSNGIRTIFLLRGMAEKSAVYDEHLQLSLLGVVSLIPTLSQICVLITTLYGNTAKTLSFEKNVFFTFPVRNRERVARIFL
jgi:hypothetical protein